jgi:hypothetical protein
MCLLFTALQARRVTAHGFRRSVQHTSLSAGRFYRAGARESFVRSASPSHKPFLGWSGMPANAA